MQRPSFVAVIMTLTTGSGSWKLARSTKHYHCHLSTLLLVENISLFHRCLLCIPWMVLGALVPGCCRLLCSQMLQYQGCTTDVLLYSTHATSASPSAHTEQGMKWLWAVYEHRKGLTDMAGSTLTVFSEAIASGLKRKREYSAAKDIPRFPPVCAYQWEQLLTSVADFLWICVFWWEAMLFA